MNFMKKRGYIIFLNLIIILSLSRSSTDFIYTHRYNGNPPSSDISSKSIFIFGAMYGPSELDPHVANLNSFNVIGQVCEGLYRYNLSDPSLGIVPNLATALGIWSSDKKNYTVSLRHNVTFHDGTKFNATAVKFSFDRLTYFIEQGFCRKGELYYYWDISSMSSKLIINRTEVINEYTIKLVLDAPYPPLPALLCFYGSYILSPSSTNATTPINIATGDLIGTGPFMYDGNEYYVEVNFHAFEDYWRGKADIETMKFSVITDSNAKHAALLAGNIDFLRQPLTSWIPTFEGDPYITVLDAGNKGGVIQYLGMNNMRINQTIRHAISSAINYSYIIEEIRERYAFRLKSPIPNGILDANDSFNVSVYDLTWARLLMRSMFPAETAGLNMSTEETNSNWRDLTASSPLLIYNYTYNIGNPTREAILPLLQDNLSEIGIKVTDAGMTWQMFYNRLYELEGLHRNHLELYWLGWEPKYNDPINYINPLFTNRTISSNGVQYNNPQVQLWMEEAVVETDKAKRQELYNKIQKQIVEVDKPWAFGYILKLYYAHHKDLTGFQPNALDMISFYECKWNRSVSYEIEISHPADITYYVGSTGNNITWIITGDPLLNPTYYVYRNNTLNETNSWESSIPVVINIDGLPIGSYEYRIEAHNGEVIEEDVVMVIVSLGTEISHPADVTYVEGSIGNSIIWNITAYKLINSIYYMYRNNTLNNTNSWESGVPINISVDGLSTGVYEYRIEAHNGDDIVEDIVILSVIPKEEDQELKIIPGYPIIVLFGISFLILSYIYEKTRIK